MKKALFYLTAIVLCLYGCKNQPTNSLPTQPEKYIEEVISLLKSKSVNKNKINWDAFRKEVYQHAQNSQTVLDTYPSITFAVSRLEDSHSYFAPAVETNNPEEEGPLPVLKDESVPENIGYIRLPFCIGNEEHTKEYISSITDKLAAQKAKNIKGWVIDLRENFGGDMWPMLVAIGPLLNNGVQGYFIDTENNASQWKYENGKAFSGSSLSAENKRMISLPAKNSKIAVLINNRTASSGEAMAVIFKGYPNARFFGEKTFGVSTGCESFTLSDGSRINLATTVFADRNKNKYGKSIIPDVSCGSDMALDKAIEWIAN